MKTATKNPIEVIAETLGLNPNTLQPDADLRKDLGFDSLEIIELVTELEKHYQIAIPDELLDKLKTVRQFEEYVQKVRPLYIETPSYLKVA